MNHNPRILYNYFGISAGIEFGDWDRDEDVFKSVSCKVAVLSDLAKKAGSIANYNCSLKSASAKQPLNYGFNLITILKADVTIKPWKSTVTINCHLESGTKLTVTNTGTLTLTTFATIALKHVAH